MLGELLMVPKSPLKRMPGRRTKKQSGLTKTLSSFRRKKRGPNES